MYRPASALLCLATWLFISRIASAGPAPTLDFAHRDFADPFILRAAGAYYAFATNGASAHVQVARSTDLRRWTVLPDALPALPRWASTDATLVWAPAVLQRGAHYVLYYTARDRRSGFQCISRALSPRPEGPYRDDSERPFVCQVEGASSLCGSIDPSPFVDRSGAAYLLWKSDENALRCHRAPRIWSQRLSEDGMALLGRAHPLLTDDRGWEGSIVEGPSMVHQGGSWWLFYSANAYETAAYAIGYAICAGPVGPCTKVTKDRPLLGSRPGATGPGGEEFFHDDRGRLWMAYHAWDSTSPGYAHGGARVLRIAPVRFADHAPRIEDSPMLGDASPAPKSQSLKLWIQSTPRPAQRGSRPRGAARPGGGSVMPSSAATI